MADGVYRDWDGAKGKATGQASASMFDVDKKQAYSIFARC